MVRNISHRSLLDSKCCRRSPSTETARTIRQPCSSWRLVLTFDRATESVRAISSACSGLGERNRSACTWATVRLTPQRVPISPQWRINFSATGVRVAVLVVSVISVQTEYTEYTGGCQAQSIKGWRLGPVSICQPRLAFRGDDEINLAGSLPDDRQRLGGDNPGEMASRGDEISDVTVLEHDGVTFAPDAVHGGIHHGPRQVVSANYLVGEQHS